MNFVKNFFLQIHNLCMYYKLSLICHTVMWNWYIALPMNKKLKNKWSSVLQAQKGQCDIVIISLLNTRGLYNSMNFLPINLKFARLMLLDNCPLLLQYIWLHRESKSQIGHEFHKFRKAIALRSIVNGDNQRLSFEQPNWFDLLENLRQQILLQGLS